MAQGLEVLQAALAGKRVRFYKHEAWSSWINAEELRWFEIYCLWHYDWEIEDPRMTFAEAVAAIEAGAIVERPNRFDTLRLTTQFRRQGTDYEARFRDDEGGWTAWHYEGFAYEDIHATDWRVVTAEPQDERPTAGQLEAYLTDQQPLLTTIPEFIIGLRRRWPDWIREDPA